MWVVQRVFGDDWRSIAVFQHRASAEAVARCWHEAGGDHQAYRAAEVEDPPADLLLGVPATPPSVAEAIEAVRSELAAFLAGHQT